MDSDGPFLKHTVYISDSDELFLDVLYDILYTLPNYLYLYQQQI